MIEVEKKFQPTGEQLEALLAGAEFLEEVVNHDAYYDYPDYRLFKNNTWLRDRNGNFELKIKKGTFAGEEIETKIGIEKYLHIENLGEFVKNDLMVIMQWETRRKKYKKEDFNLDIDETSFGYKVLEIELMVRNEEEIKGAEDKILALAARYNFPIKDLPSKRREYFRLVEPEKYEELYQNL